MDAQVVPAVALDRAAAVHPISYYDGYRGYDPAFLQVAVPLPTLTGEQRRNAATSSTAGPNDDATVLPYTHFSLVMNRARQLAYYTVVNIDGSQSVDLERTADHWFYDARIAESEQIGEELYQRNALDRGHLVRRLDPVWGPDPARANEDTFHFTNCSPQHEKFNQGTDLWAGLENYILRNAEALDRRITVFTGPVTEDTDPIYKGVRLPLAFWKIIAYCRSDGTLATAAYVLEQAALIQEILSRAAAFDPGTYRLTIADLDARTGLDFAYLAEHELPLSSGGIERAAGHVRVAENYTNVAL